MSALDRRLDEISEQAQALEARRLEVLTARAKDLNLDPERVIPDVLGGSMLASVALFGDEGPNQWPTHMVGAARSEYALGDSEGALLAVDLEEERREPTTPPDPEPPYTGPLRYAVNVDGAVITRVFADGLEDGDPLQTAALHCLQAHRRDDLIFPDAEAAVAAATSLKRAAAAELVTIEVWLDDDSPSD